MQAVILAAGQGLRLRPVTNALPKGLIEIEGRTLLEYSLSTLKQAGIEEAIIVTGFCSELIREKFKEEYSGIRIRYAFNEKYDNTGSMYSFSKARDLIDANGSVLLLESDLLYEPCAVKIMLDSPFKDAILVSGLSGSGDEVYICLDKNQRVTALGKNIPPESRRSCSGEFVGISLFSKAFLTRLFERADSDYASGQLNLHYEECAFNVNISGYPLYGCICSDLSWVEIDKEDDLDKAKTKIYPKIQRSVLEGQPNC